MFGLLLAVAVAGQATPAVDATTIVLSAPVAVVELDLGKLKGDLREMSYSPDGTQLYIQTSEPDLRLGSKVRHYLVGFDGKGPKNTDGRPAWASRYWSWKSGQAAPGMSAWKIDIEQQTKKVTTTSAPAGGDMARGAGSSGNPESSVTGMTVGEAVDAARLSQGATTVTLKLKGEIIGEFVNEAVIPGSTFSWGPSGSGLIAYANSDGHLVFMDSEGRKQEVPGSKSVMMPAFTDDGGRVAYLEKTSRKKAMLRVINVTIQ